jgi:hypothetical protein
VCCDTVAETGDRGALRRPVTRSHSGRGNASLRDPLATPADEAPIRQSEKTCYTRAAVLRHDSISRPGGKFVNASPSKLLYRIASGLLLFFAIGHTLGFRQTDPGWGVDSLVASMRTIRFDVQGFSRTYYDLFVGAGFTVGVFLLFAAVLAWQLGGLRRETLRDMPVVTWALAMVFVGVTVLSWKYLFLVPVILSALISLCLIIAAWLAGKQGNEQV